MRVIERNQWTVNVEIYPDCDGGWYLHIEDGRGNTTAWTEQSALDAALSSIATEGIDSFIGPDTDTRYLFDA